MADSGHASAFSRYIGVDDFVAVVTSMQTQRMMQRESSVQFRLSCREDYLSVFPLEPSVVVPLDTYVHHSPKICGKIFLLTVRRTNEPRRSTPNGLPCDCPDSGTERQEGRCAQRTLMSVRRCRWIRQPQWRRGHCTP